MRMLQRMKMSLVSVLSIGAAMLCSISAWADTWTDGDSNIWGYSIDIQEGVETITITNVSFTKTRLVIPSQINGKDVVSFGASVFAGKDRAVRVIIPETIVSIPSSAFAGCPNLKEITVNGQGLKSIGTKAFANSVNLECFVMPNSVADVGQGVFSCCTSLRYVKLSDAMKNIPGAKHRRTNIPNYGITDGQPGYDAYYYNTAITGTNGNGFFENCESLTNVVLGANLKDIGNIAFLNCKKLTNISIPNSVTNIGRHVFMGCEKLERVTIGNGVVKIGEMAFRGLENLTEVTFGSSVEEIGVQAFHNCSRLGNFVLPDTVSVIDYHAFGNCRELTSVEIPTNRDGKETRLGRGVFSECWKLKTVTFGDTVRSIPGYKMRRINKPGYGIIDGTTGYEAYVHVDSIANTDALGAGGDGFFQGCSSLETVNFGKGIESIGNIAFYWCTSLKNVTIPDSVKSIGYHAFLACTSLTSVVIGDGVDTIGLMAFRGLKNLKTVEFGANVRVIEGQAFAGCVSLQNFTLPSSLEDIGYRGFAECSSLTNVKIPTNRDEMETKLGNGVFASCINLETVTFGDTLKELPSVEYTGQGWSTDSYVFWYSDSSGITFQEAFADGMFYNCHSLRTINWGASIQSIGNISFLNCTSLRETTLPASVNSIGHHAFFGCTSLRKTTVMGSIDFIGRRVWGNCGALQYVEFKGDTMTHTPEAAPFIFDKDRLKVYVAANSTGWRGVLGEPGLPDDGKWCGVDITYAPPPTNVVNPYDFYLVTPTDRVSYKDYTWPVPVILTTNCYVNSRTIPYTCETIREGDPIYLSYAFDEYWRGEAFTVTNRFTLSGVKSGTFDYSCSWDAHETCSYGCKTNATPALLQNLAPGNYTLTFKLNGDNRLAETDYANNTTSITFTVVGTPRYTVSFNLNGASGTAPTSRTIYEGRTIGELPTVTAPAGWTFLGWFTAAENGEKITSSQVVNAPFVCYARWEKRDMGFYTPSSQKGWTQPLFLASSSSDVAGKTQFANGESIYVKYAFTNLAGDYDVGGFINRFTLTGAKFATFDDDWSKYKLKAGTYDDGNWAPSALQNLPDGTYTLTCTLDATGVISETNEGNNTRSITFTVVAKDGGSEPGNNESGNNNPGNNNPGNSGSGNTNPGNNGSGSDNGSNSGGGTNPPSNPPVEETEYSLFDQVNDGIYADAASVYDGYLYHLEEVAGTIQVKVSTPKKGAAKISATIQIAGQKKVTVKGEVDLTPRTFSLKAKDGRELNLDFGSMGMIGDFDIYDIEGVRNLFSSKDKTEKANAEADLNPWLGKTLNMSLENGVLAVTIAKKGKVTVKGTVQGTVQGAATKSVKVSAKAQALVGEKWICIPVTYSKSGVNLAFTLWLNKETKSVEVVGLDGDPKVGMPGKLKAGTVFNIDQDILVDIDTEDEATLELLPIGERVSVNDSGKKWIVADGAKAAKVTYKKGELTIAEGKKGQGVANASGLKLTYKAKDGSFKGSFTAYAIVKGKLKKHKATVTGVLINGIGYGTATIKKVGTWAVEIK